MLRITVEYVNSRGSTVFLASLYIKKAFDRVRHERFFEALKNAGPVQAISLNRCSAYNWYTKLVVNVRWVLVIPKCFQY